MLNMITAYVSKLFHRLGAVVYLTFFLIVIAVSVFILSACATYYEGPVSDHFDGSEFHNHGSASDGSRLKILWKLLTDSRPSWPENPPITYDKPPKRVFGSKLRVTFVGHASVLIQTEGLNILTDPIWSRRASPVSWAGPARLQPAAIRFDDLPPIDIILISHNHYDHMNLDTITRLQKRDQPVILVPLGNDVILARHDSSIKAIALDWGERHKINSRIDIALEPMQHWSSRWGWIDYNKALWGAFAITAPSGNIYFAGDTGYAERYYQQAQKNHRRFRLAILPIGTYKPRWFFNYAHQDSIQAVQAHKQLQAAHSLAIHFNAFQLSWTAFDEAVRLLENARKQANIPADAFQALRPGQFWWVPQNADNAN